MPQWGKTEFDRFYVMNGERWGHPSNRPSVKLHYNWFPIIRDQAAVYAPMLFQTLGMNAGDSVVMVGCGFNGTGEGLQALGVNVIGIDVSTYIDAEKGNTEEADVRAACALVGLDPDVDQVIGPPGNVMVDPLDLWLDGGRAAPKPRGRGSILPEDMGNNGSRNAVKRALASTPRYAISEEVLNSISDSEALQACDYAAAFAADTGCTVVHMLSPLQPYGREGRQASELNWKTYAQWRAFLDANGFNDQLILPTVTAHMQGMSLGDGRQGVVIAYSGTF